MTKRDIEFGNYMNTNDNANTTGLIAQYKVVDEEANRIIEQEKKYGNTPVVYLPKRNWVRPVPIPSLAYFISQAATEAEVNNLLNRGKEEYKKATTGTIKKWTKAAEQRIIFLKNTKK